MTKHKAKRVSNYELFFDLAVVLAIGRLTSAIHLDHLNLTSIFLFVAGCGIILNIWNYEAFYYNKYGDSRRDDIYTIILLMLWVGNLAISFNFDLHELTSSQMGIQSFNIMLVLSYATIALQYFLKGRKIGFTPHIRSNIILQLIYLIPLIPVAMGWLGYTSWLPLYSLMPLFVPFILRLPLLKTWHDRHFENDFNFPHFLERSQLLTILTFGETVIAIIQTYPLTSFPTIGLTLFLGMATLFMFYMNQTYLNINHHQKVSLTGLFYSHALIVMSLLFFTVGLEFLADHHHHEIGVSFFIGAIIAFYIGVLSTSVYNQEIYRLNRATLLKYMGTLTIGCFAIFMARDHVALMGAILTIMNYSMVRMNMNFRKQQREKHNVPHPDPTKNLRDFS